MRTDYTPIEKIVMEMLTSCKYFLKFCDLNNFTEEDIEKIEQANALLIDVLEDK